VVFKTYYYKIKNIFNLAFQLAKAEFKLRNEGSYLGIVWYLLGPILMFILLFLVFADRLGNNIPLYPLYLLLGLIVFNFFQSATTEATRSIINDHRFLIKSINFPRESLILAVVLKNVFSHLFEVVLFFIVAQFFNVSLFSIFYYLIILFLFFLFTFGVSLFLSSLTVYFVDLENIWIFVSRILWLATPIFYAIENQHRLFIFNLFNPLYCFITAIRNFVLYNSASSWWMLLIILFYVLVSFFIGLIMFYKLKKKFAEMI